jgi:hypothetical protein
MNNVFYAVLAASDPGQVANTALWVQLVVIAVILTAVLVVRPKDR